jgi:hypothetical protein
MVRGRSYPHTAARSAVKLRSYEQQQREWRGAIPRVSVQVIDAAPSERVR